MTEKLKRDQLPPRKVKQWEKSFIDEQKLTFNLNLSQLILQKETYKILAGENENRIRIYLGLENNKKDGKYELCAFAVSAFLLGSGDVYADYETPVFKLAHKNIDYSDNTQAVIESIRLYRRWRAGELDAEDETAPVRQYIYPNGYLLTKFELHELFNAQKHKEVSIEFGIEKSMSAMLSAAPSAASSKETGQANNDEVFDFAKPCPPVCDERSVYNPS